MFFAARSSSLLCVAVTKIYLRPKPALLARFASLFANSFDLAVVSKFSTIINFLSLALSVKTVNNALRNADRFIFRDQLRALVGPKVTPPCRQSGERTEPARARPVPFCFQGFFPDPATSPRFFV